MEPNPRYARSHELFERANLTVPLASQTFSKSYLTYPLDHAPLFMKRGKGSHAWDVDGNEYIDFVSALLPVVLGYCDPEVDAAVIEQIGLGASMSLATELEVDLSERLCDLIPCSEMVRYGKNGSDATGGAVRLARAYTGRDRVATCGYHGWQDWYIGTTARNRGVPLRVRELTHPFPFNDIGALDAILKTHRNEFACVIMEPMNIEEPNEGYLSEVKELAHRHGALFILDEIITGFRFALGGAQELFEVTPDLATFGKGLGNGYSVSAIAGSAKIMHLMEEIFFSFTSGGETLGLAAALATIGKIERNNVIDHLWTTGKRVEDSLTKKFIDWDLSRAMSTAGKPPWLLLKFRDSGELTGWQLKTLFMQEMLARGILIQSSHNFSYAHSGDDIDKLLSTYDEVLPILSDALHNNAISQHLKAPVMQPLFQVR